MAEEGIMMETIADMTAKLEAAQKEVWKLTFVLQQEYAHRVISDTPTMSMEDIDKEVADMIQSDLEEAEEFYLRKEGEDDRGRNNDGNHS